MLPTIFVIPVISTLAKVLNVLTVKSFVIVVFSVNTIFPLPSARKSKLSLDIRVLIKLSSISIILGGIIISFKTKSCAMFTLTTCALSTLTLLLTFKLLLGIRTLPVPVALSSRFVLLVVVVIKLSSNNISSNCAFPVTSKFWAIVRLPVNP